MNERLINREPFRSPVAHGDVQAGVHGERTPTDRGGAPMLGFSARSPSARRVVLAFACLVVGGFVTECVRQRLIVPRLAGWHAIPAVWSVPLLVPLAAGVLGSGVVVRRARELWTVAGLVGLLGFVPGGQTVDPVLEFAVGFMLTGVSVGAVAGAAALVRRRRLMPFDVSQLN